MFLTAASPGERSCDHPGCTAPGEFRAPRSPQDLQSYYWFCLAHVRAYNAGWDYYRGMSPEESEASRRADVVGQRPSWPLGRTGSMSHIRLDRLKEAFKRAFGDTQEWARARKAEKNGNGRQRAKGLAGAMAEALAVLELSHPVTFDQIKARYKELVKRHHPDANGGDKEAEERLKSINQAYTTLKVHVAKPGLGG
jgi:hypothetical protein